jgi:hypothetical protein
VPATALRAASEVVVSARAIVAMGHPAESCWTGLFLIGIENTCNQSFGRHGVQKEDPVRRWRWRNVTPMAMMMRTITMTIFNSSRK